MEDAKVSGIVKKLLQAAITTWPRLRDGMNISADAFYTDLKPPAEGRDYEDPLEEERQRPTRLSEDDAVESREGHRIVLEDSEDTPERERATTFPLRKENGTARDRAALAPSPNDDLPQRAPTLPPRRARATSGVSSGNASVESASLVPKRKPAPPILDPPRYSTVFDEDGNSLHVADSPASYAPVDGFGPPRRGNWSLDEDMKKGFPPPIFPEPTNQHPALAVPKRKAVSSDQKTNGAAETMSPQSADTASARTASASESGVLAKLAAQKAAANLAHQVAAAAAPKASVGDTEVVQSPESVLVDGDGVFRKPSWPASAHPASLAKPVIPRHAQTIPQITANGASLAAPSMPKPRAPSPGLLKRISSMEVSSDTAASSTSSLQPRRLNLRKTSVDDLRRLYEERVSTAQSLARADAVRKGSAST